MIKNISAVIEDKKGKILLLKRNSNEKWYPKKWCIVAEKMKENETPDKCFKRGLIEEIGIEDCKEIEKKEPYLFEDGDFKRIIYPYRCKIDNNDIKINYEHSDYKWVTLEELFSLDIAKPVKSALESFYEI
ncbi:MAG: NUDIX domain-containing protein [Candidatus Pacebacteria bacterium]|nr:NUDIX domain-containing protein [Candidatus Paceibacterota bacterium]